MKWLVEQGYLQRVPLTGQEDIFQINPEKVREAKGLIDERHDGRGPNSRKIRSATRRRVGKGNRE